jgi:hypothetical protein
MVIGIYFKKLRRCLNYLSTPLEISVRGSTTLRTTKAAKRPIMSMASGNNLSLNVPSQKDFLL